jgi:hypothetical protein
MIYLILIFYILLACFFLREWLGFFLDDKEMTPKMRWLCGVILAIATILWPIVVPFAYLELLKFHQKNKEVINLLLELSNAKIIDDSYTKQKLYESMSLRTYKSSKFQVEDE